MTDRLQLNLRLDGRRDLLELCKEVAATEGLSLNAWVIKQLELGVTTPPKVPTGTTTRQPLDTVVDTTRQSLDTVVDTTRQLLDRTVAPLDKILDIEEATELPGKHHLSETAGASPSVEWVDTEPPDPNDYEFREEFDERYKVWVAAAIQTEPADDLDPNELAAKNFPGSEAESLQQELEGVKADRAKLLESSTHITNKLRQEVHELRSQLETERTDREQVEAELAELKKNSATASRNLPEAADLLNQLKAKRRKSTVSLADVETLLEIIEKSCDDTPKGL